MEYLAHSSSRSEHSAKLRPPHIGTRHLARARKGLGLTQRDLALAAGVGERFFVELEAGKPTAPRQGPRRGPRGGPAAGGPDRDVDTLSLPLYASEALGRPPAAKYEHNRAGVKGPARPEMFALVRTHMTAGEITRLLDAVIVNVAIGNVDSHAKTIPSCWGPAGRSLRRSTT